MPKPKIFPNPFAPVNPNRRRTWAELERMPRHERLARMREEEQAEMRKEAEVFPGEWFTTISGYAVFVPDYLVIRPNRLPDGSLSWGGLVSDDVSTVDLGEDLGSQRDGHNHVVVEPAGG